VGKHRTITITLRWRTAAALVPAAVLAASGVALSQAGVSSSGSALPSVPPVPVTQPATTPFAAGGDRTDIPPVAPALVLPKGVVPGSAQPVQLDSGPGIPAPALTAYRQAAALLGRADPGCHLDWALLGAIGRVESNHARFGGNALDHSGIARPGIIGIPLDGRPGTALIRDTDRGRWDRDTVYDRAVGPMQFIPGTWRSVGADGDGDGERNPQSMADAATTAGVYLCSGSGDLRQTSDLYRAIRRYNNSDSYARTVMAIATAYRHGVTALPADQLPAARPADVASDEPAPPSVRRTGPGSGSASEGTDAADAGAPPGGSPGSGSAGPGAGSSVPAGGAGGAPAGGTSSRSSAPTGSPARPPVGDPVGSAAASVSAGLSSAVSSAASLVTSVVTVPVPLDQPIVTCVTDLVKNPLGILTQAQTCTTTTTTSTTTTTVATAP
jgi:hypothetical protein